MQTLAAAQYVGDVRTAYEAAYASSVSISFYDAGTKSFTDGVSVLSSMTRRGGSISFQLMVRELLMSLPALQAAVEANSATNFIAVLASVVASGGYAFVVPSAASLVLQPAIVSSSGVLYGTASTDSSGGVKWWGVLLIVLAILTVLTIVGYVLSTRAPESKPEDKASELEMRPNSAVVREMHLDAGVEAQAKVDVEARVDMDIEVKEAEGETMQEVDVDDVKLTDVEAGVQIHVNASVDIPAQERYEDDDQSGEEYIETSETSFDDETSDTTVRPEEMAAYTAAKAESRQLQRVQNLRAKAIANSPRSLQTRAQAEETHDL